MNKHAGDYEDPNHFIHRDQRTFGEALIHFVHTTEDVINRVVDQSLGLAHHAVHIAHVVMPEHIHHN